MGISAAAILSDCCFFPLDGSAGASEATIRAVISRTYYSTYHTIRPHVESLPEVKASVRPGLIGHREAYRRLQRWDHPDADIRKNFRNAAKVASLALLKAIEVRECADYDLAATITEVDCELQVSRLAAVTTFASRYAAAIAPSIPA
ncbi:hypothetical protein [Luteibacter sp. UNCMF331Sha3.1]|uniref:hypothetical protein n=1 Tax=Luteibacter sp. UNCMF331Sha3.1 TaxID=1502760 RepID=UPI001113B480|nr:hypothetical protein [Luteibacter sp. UNCMF331Sha3.1]